MRFSTNSVFSQPAMKQSKQQSVASVDIVGKKESFR
jgi:hypothetical protein